MQAAQPASAPTASTIVDANTWPDLVSRCALGGPARELAAHAAFLGYEDGILRLAVSQADEHLKVPALIKRLSDALAKPLGTAPQIRFEEQKSGSETLHQRTARERDARQVAAESAFLADPDVQRLMQRHGATLVPDSIRPVDEA